MNESDHKRSVAAYPPPLVPSDVDLRDFRFMPLDVVQLQNSETWAMADGWAAKALVNIWTKAWHQVPAGSLPDNDDLHRTWANVPNWDSVREIALRGFVKCSDGRLYHRVICQKAHESWKGRKRFRQAAKARWRNKKPKDATHVQRTSNAHAMDGQQQHATQMQGIGTGIGKKRKNAASAASAVGNEADLFRRGKALLGDSAGGLINNLIKAKAGSIALARAAIETASTKQNPREYIAGCIHGSEAAARPNGWDPRL